MKYYVVDNIWNYKSKFKNINEYMLFLERDNWDDFGYKSSFVLYIVIKGNLYKIGNVKIGTKESNHGYVEIPQTFTSLDNRYYSLGQSSEYYMNLRKVSYDESYGILRDLKDISFDLLIYNENKIFHQMKVSLMRDISEFTVKNEFSRLAKRDEELTNYSFGFNLQFGDLSEIHRIDFNVDKFSFLPTNVHALIGRNGCGKTSIMKAIFYELTGQSYRSWVKIRSELSVESPENQFSGVIFISFSPFDELKLAEDKVRKLKSNYIGLIDTKNKLNTYNNNVINKNIDDLCEDFLNYLKIICKRGRVEYYLEILEMINTDPIFLETGLGELLKSITEKSNRDSILIEAVDLFRNMSSGHKIVLLVITGMAALVSQQTLVLMDEPEQHLHPPLLGTLIRTISKILHKRNGVAIISTHSPVVLQEIPHSCIWKIKKTDFGRSFTRLDGETFGENVGRLTRDVFQKEATESGYFNLIKKIVDKYSSDTSDSIRQKFLGQLGSEAEMFLELLLYKKEEDEEYY